MSVKVTATFQEGISIQEVSNSLVTYMREKDYHVDGQLDHQEETVNNQVVLTDTWENEAKLNAFLHDFALPAFDRAGIPTPEIKMS